MYRKLSSNKYYYSFLLFLLFVDTKTQVIQTNDGLNQQIQSKIERINLKDFGIQRRSEKEEDHKLPKVSVMSTFGLPKENTSYERNWRHNLRLTQNTRSYSRRDSQDERDKSSPLDWTSSPKQIGLVNNPDFKLRRAFNLPSNVSFESAQNTQKRNCSQDCVPKKYLQHYGVKGCVPIIDFECNCALSFNCESPQTTNSTVCQYEDRIYEIGSRIPVRNPCRICECRDFGRRRGQVLAEIDCGIGIECPESAFGIRPEPNCYFAYQRDQCCGYQVCDNTLSAKRREKICRYRDREFKRGQKIYPQEDSCKMCLCTDQWNDNEPLESGACQTYSCEFELDKEFQSGCLPIYHEGSCCPIEYKCPKTLAKTRQMTDQNHCLFDGRRYSIGSRLITENVCVDCVCRAPPDFTCVHKSCPTPAHNCYVGKWDHSVCCQHYICSRPDHIRDESQLRTNFYSN